MSRFLFFILFQLFFAVVISAQDSGNIYRTDTILQPDTSISKDSLLSLQMADSVLKRPMNDWGWRLDPRIDFSIPSLSRQILEHHPYYDFEFRPINVNSGKKQFKGKESLFYVLIFLLLLFALFKKLFPRYFNDLFRLFFRTTLKQRQIREQLIQTPLPSLLFNGFFILTAALYIDFLLEHFNLKPVDDFWLLYLYCVVGLSGVYLTRFLGLKLSGWVFNIQEATDSYIFIVFIVNKIIGICLLPFLVLLAFSTEVVYSSALTISWYSIGILLIYRFILSFKAVRNQVKVNLFHFFLYLMAFEIIPLLLIYKVLLYLIR